ncbi:hypothetical protein ILYODFUR_030145 [Ilyodon furcidens]|uniref:Uncharacterized protein n=1 Tax=Ilyodon furcidens TaxID=33524 RepID=A0ABV0TP58_9TELE
MLGCGDNRTRKETQSSLCPATLPSFSWGIPRDSLASLGSSVSGTCMENLQGDEPKTERVSEDSETGILISFMNGKILYCCLVLHCLFSMIQFKAEISTKKLFLGFLFAAGNCKFHLSFQQRCTKSL